MTNNTSNTSESAQPTAAEARKANFRRTMRNLGIFAAGAAVVVTGVATANNVLKPKHEYSQEQLDEQFGHRPVTVQNGEGSENISDQVNQDLSDVGLKDVKAYIDKQGKGPEGDLVNGQSVNVPIVPGHEVTATPTPYAQEVGIGDAVKISK